MPRNAGSKPREGERAFRLKWEPVSRPESALHLRSWSAFGRKTGFHFC
jgi:hypothetical protein